MPTHTHRPPMVVATTVPAHVVWDRALLDYNFGPAHPMAPTRLDLTMRLVEAWNLLTADHVSLTCAPIASDEILNTVHDRDYIAAVQAASQRGVTDVTRGLGTEDDPIFPQMHEAAARIVGGTQAAAAMLGPAIASGTAAHAVNIAGGMHHAMPDAASGFCIYNDSAIAINQLLADGAQRVVYLDIDAHHGDGVERIFWNDPRVMTISIHQSGQSLFPGTGAAADVGGPAALGYAVNIALPPRTDGPQWLRAWEAVVPAVLAEFQPDVVVSQHGCDAHREDPLSDLAVCLGAQRLAAQWIHEWAHQYAGGRWLAVGGGGYAIARVVPVAWAGVIGEVVHCSLDDEAPFPAAWLDFVHQMTQERPPDAVGSTALAISRWRDGFDLDDPVDRAILATRRAIFPQWGLDPLLD